MAWSFKIPAPFFERASPLRTCDFSFSKTKDQKKSLVRPNGLTRLWCRIAFGPCCPKQFDLLSSLYWNYFDLSTPLEKNFF